MELANKSNNYNNITDRSNSKNSHHLCETPTRLFSPVIFVANLMFTGRQNKTKIEKVMQRQQQPRAQEKPLRQRKHSPQDAQAHTPKEPPKYRYPQPPEKINPSLHRTSDIPMPMRYRTSARKSS
ncbi:uncharacterized protein LOC119635512 [Glossina fuscipes]|uniref:Uncharacterized protein LOC119635512 n=1 Tax=Glossina fuscipes TaxID=7396 RepID=A0A9C6DPE3_9MUSC|nr:uncharacterized protein LOC119635512 [Glossina fuscipes]